MTDDTHTKIFETFWSSKLFPSVHKYHSCRTSIEETFLFVVGSFRSNYCSAFVFVFVCPCVCVCVCVWWVWGCSRWKLNGCRRRRRLMVKILYVGLSGLLTIVWLDAQTDAVVVILLWKESLSFRFYFGWLLQYSVLLLLDYRIRNCILIRMICHCYVNDDNDTVLNNEDFIVHRGTDRRPVRSRY